MTENHIGTLRFNNKAYNQDSEILVSVSYADDEISLFLFEYPPEAKTHVEGGDVEIGIRSKNAQRLLEFLQTAISHSPTGAGEVGRVTYSRSDQAEDGPNKGIIRVSMARGLVEVKIVVRPDDQMPPYQAVMEENVARKLALLLQLALKKLAIRK